MEDADFALKVEVTHHLVFVTLLLQFDKYLAFICRKVSVFPSNYRQLLQCASGQIKYKKVFNVQLFATSFMLWTASNF